MIESLPTADSKLPERNGKTVGAARWSQAGYELSLSRGRKGQLSGPQLPRLPESLLGHCEGKCLRGQVKSGQGQTHCFLVQL